jgi:DNA-binding MarR family transcriptional regulator
MVSEDPSRRPPLSYMFRFLHQRYADEVDAALREAGFDDIRPASAKVFPFVPPEGVHVAELAARAGVRKQSMGETVDHLERAGYLERRLNEDDKRSRLVFLTERGESVRPVAAQAGRRVEERWASLIGSEQIESLRTQLLDLLEKVRFDDRRDPSDPHGRG